MPARAWVFHPDLGVTKEVAAEAVRIMARSGWQLTDPPAPPAKPKARKPSPTPRPGEDTTAAGAADHPTKEN